MRSTCFLVGLGGLDACKLPGCTQLPFSLFLAVVYRTEQNMGLLAYNFTFYLDLTTWGRGCGFGTTQEAGIHYCTTQVDDQH